jgi:hypothetical protein
MGGFHHIGLSLPIMVAFKANVIPVECGISWGLQAGPGFHRYDFSLKSSHEPLIIKSNKRSIKYSNME